MTESPWMKFYPADWRAEPKLRCVSRAARSLWIDLICLIHEGGDGRLHIDGRNPSDKELASILGDNPRTIRKLLGELEEAGVSSRDDAGFIFSRRMQRDKAASEQAREHGRMGGNPQLRPQFDQNSASNSERINNEPMSNESRMTSEWMGQSSGKPGKNADEGVNPLDKPRARALEARSQKLEARESVPVSDSVPKRESEQVDRNPPDGGSPATKYAFEARTIRLNPGDHERWRQAYPHLSLDAELEALDDWAGEQVRGGKKWFPAVANALAKKNREAMERKAARETEATRHNGKADAWRTGFDAKGRALNGGYASGADPRL